MMEARPGYLPHPSDCEVTWSRATPPNDSRGHLEEVPMPPQRLGADQMQDASPPAGQSSHEDQKHSIVAV